MSQLLHVHIIACIKAAQIRAHWEMLLSEAEAAIARNSATRGRTQVQVSIAHEKSLESAERRCKEMLCGPDHAVILISDALLHVDEEWKPQWRQTSAGKELRLEFVEQLYVSIAIDDACDRVPDIDLVLPKSCDTTQFVAGLQLLLERLLYYAPPPKGRPTAQELKIEYGRIRSLTELRDAFRLRHAVYRVMGYLHAGALASSTAMEINYCDLYSNHYGAFAATSGGGRELVGGARLILVAGSAPHYRAWAEKIYSKSNTLKKFIARERGMFAQFKLPIFQTLALSKEMKEAFRHSPWGELSRVIVAPNWRGSGISKELIQFVLDDADRMRIPVILLECLDLHQKMYEAFDFSSLRQRGEVLGISKTMVAMRRDHPSGSVTREVVKRLIEQSTSGNP
jgi:predicted GNAT family N-acyltransferase